MGMKISALTLAGAVLLTAFSIAIAETHASPPFQQASDRDIIRGIVKEKSNGAIILMTMPNHEDFKTTPTRDTTYFKDGKPATLSDVVVGGHVRVTLKHATHEALEVQIAPSTE